jgi:hypothetical protein
VKDGAGSSELHFSEPLPKGVLRSLYACTQKPEISRLSGVFYDKKNGNVVASNATILVCLPAIVKSSRIVFKDAIFDSKIDYPDYLSIIPRPSNALIRETFSVSWGNVIEKALSSAEKGEPVFMSYNNTKTKIIFDAKLLMKIIKFFRAVKVSAFTVESIGNAQPVVLRSVNHSMCLGLIMPFIQYDDKSFIVPLN